MQATIRTDLDLPPLAGVPFDHPGPLVAITLNDNPDAPGSSRYMVQAPAPAVVEHGGIRYRRHPVRLDWYEPEPPESVAAPA